jgi:hypothetical protein
MSELTIYVAMICISIVMLFAQAQLFEIKDILKEILKEMRK